MRKSIATVSVSGTLEEKLAAIAAAGFDAIELLDSDLVASPLRPAVVARRCADLGLAIDLYQPLRDVEGVDPRAFPHVLHRVARKLDVMGELGATTMLACSNATPQAVDDPDLRVEQIRAVADLAYERGCTLAFEALAWGTHVNRVQQAWELVRRAGHPAVGLAVDTFHILARGDDEAALTGIPGERIAVLQIADAPHLRTDVLEWSRHHRCFPGQGTFDLAGVVGTVLEAGYRGPLSLEVFSDLVREADPRVTALDAMRSLLHLEEQLRARWRPREPHRVQQRPQVALADPPPVPAGLRTSFVEVAVCEDDSLAPLLLGMGFARAGTHRSKPLSWWRNGGAHVLLNAASDHEYRSARPVDRPSVTSLGLEVDDVPAFAARRAAMLWPALTLRRGPRERALAGVDGPAGLHVLVTGRPGSPDDWRVDFDPEPVATGTWPGSADPPPWLGIDHVGYAVPFDLSDAEISFHRTLFGLTAGTVSEFADPHGRLRSRVVRTEAAVPGRGPQIVLNVIEGRSPAQATGINQVAFGCPDVFAAARAMREAGVGLLEVPDNYYDDLQARFDLPGELLARLRDHGVLYDRQADGSELLHIYTRLVGGRFYVEVLQRIGDYTGFGSPNTPVRLAAQAAQDRDARPALLPTRT